MEQWQRETLEKRISELPIVQYAWLKNSDIPFSGRVREICRTECPRYGTSWSCPPGVGTVEKCRARCAQFDGTFVFTTIAEVSDIENMEETLATRAGHVEIIRQVAAVFAENALDCLCLSGESCDICPHCSYPDAPCRFPQKMLPCIEGWGIVVPLLAEQTGIEFNNGANVVTWFGLILRKEISKERI